MSVSNTFSSTAARTHLASPRQKQQAFKSARTVSRLKRCQDANVKPARTASAEYVKMLTTLDERCVCRALRMDSSSEPSPDRCRWFPAARLNIAHCALHSQRALPSCPAMVWAEQDSPSVLHSMTIEQLRASVAQTAWSVLQLFKPGEYMHTLYHVHCIITSGTVTHCLSKLAWNAALWRQSIGYFDESVEFLPVSRT